MVGALRRVAALYDIHGNVAALDAVLSEISDLDVDLIVVGGDVAWGPFPRQTVERLKNLEDAVFIRGNADREVAGETTADLDEVVTEINEWCWSQLEDDQRRWLENLDETVVIDIENLGRALFCHGSPRSDEEILTVATPPERLGEAFRVVDNATVVCGHTHMQFDIRVTETRVVNAGSVGLPYEEESGAYWALLGPDVEFRRSMYDTYAALEAMARSGCPHVEMVFMDTLRDPPPQADVVRQFESAAEKQTY